MRIQPASRLVLVAVASLAGACGSVEPCVDCPDVSGTYEFTSPGAGPEKSSCQTLMMNGFAGSAEVRQDGNAVTFPAITTSDPLTGTLMSNLVVSFEPYPTETVDRDPVNADIVGSFRARDGGFVFKGSLNFTMAKGSSTPGCRLSVPFEATRY